MNNPTPGQAAGSPQVLSDQHKEAVRAWVPRIRQVLEEEFAAQLERLGFDPNGLHTSLDKMRLPAEALAVRRRVEALIARDSVAEGSAARGYENVRRELAYTLLNRLVGLKAMEARQLLYLPPPGNPQGTPEQTEVITPVPGQARSRYLRDFRAAGGGKYKYEDDAEETLLRDGLTAAFRHITQEIRVLFDPDHEYACIWPTHATIMVLIKMINEDLPDEAYRAQDFLGWVYQFFVGRPKPGEKESEKGRVRRESKGTPRSSYELAVINQFYTPSWVVKALVDNTLGRLWLQMHPDSALALRADSPLSGENLIDQPAVDYLVPRTGENVRYHSSPSEGHVETFKLAREVTLLDPACGTMHFGQYAFGLFHQMYLDEIEHAGETGWPTEPSVPEARDIPAAILEHNLFGVDIDPRAIQIASLSLLLTAKEASLKHGFTPLDTKVQRSNLVVAHAVDLGAEPLQALVDHIGGRLGEPALRQRLFETIWENLRAVGELGSLVQVRESVERLLDEWVTIRARDRGTTKLSHHATRGQLELGSILTEADRKRSHQLELQRRLLEEEAQQLQQELLVAIENAASHGEGNPTDRLFAEDTARGLKLLQMLSRRYDVVVMNPPYGRVVPASKDYVKAAYGDTATDIYAAFVERGTQLATPDGYVGALTSATFMNSITRLRTFRIDYLLCRTPLLLLLDLGDGILDDAAVETAAYVVRSRKSALSSSSSCAFIDLTTRSGQTGSRWQDALVACLSGKEDRRFDIALDDFAAIDGAPLAYRRVGIAAFHFRTQVPLARLASIQQGVITREDPRFVRRRWEVEAKDGGRWVRVQKGGSFGRFYHDTDLVIDWSDRAKACFARLRDTSLYFRAGLTWPLAAGVFNVRRMDHNCVFTHKGPAILLHNASHEAGLLGFLNSSLGLFFARVLSARENMGGRWEVGVVRRMPIAEAVLNPHGLIAELANTIHNTKMDWDLGNETATCFDRPWLLSKTERQTGALSRALDQMSEIEQRDEEQIQSLYGRLNEEVFQIYGITPTVRKSIEDTLGEQVPEVLWPEMEGKSAQQRRMEHVWRLLSYAVMCVLMTDDDGIVPFGAVNGEPRLVERIRHQLAEFFPGRDPNQTEVEIVNELNTSVKGYRRCSSLDEWLESAFFEYHCGLYRGRPIFWHIASTQGTSPFSFSALVHYHRFDKNRMAKLRASYLRDAIEEFRREAGLADKAGRSDDRLEWQAKVEEAQALDKKLQLIQEGRCEGAEGGERDYRILTPWKEPGDRPKGWAPDLDDGVKVNIEPFEKAGILRIGRVT